MGGESEEDESGEQRETRNQMLNRHKRELQFEKKKARSLSKKEAKARVEAVQQRHDEELLQLPELVESAESRSRGTHGNDSPCGECGQDEGRYDGGLGSLDPSAFHDVSADRSRSSDTQQQNTLTKAQKRRLKKQREEEERERRIAREKAEQGPSAAEQEDEELSSKIRELQLRVEPIKPDGHCLYRAVAHCAGIDTSDEGVYSLRRQVASYLREHSAEYEPFVDEDSGGLECWCRQLESTSTWGGFLELRVMAQLLQQPVIVHSVALGDVHIRLDDLGHKTPLRLAYLQHAYGLGEHYNALALDAT
jgi:OTU domain-containing protein 6